MFTLVSSDSMNFLVFDTQYLVVTLAIRWQHLHSTCPCGSPYTIFILKVHVGAEQSVSLHCCHILDLLAPPPHIYSLVTMGTIWQ